MPLFGKGNDKGINYKARLEHKLYLARENPDPVFDVSDCNLKSVPTGIYSLCKVFRKESLLLQNNILTSLSGGGAFEDLYLLQILDIRKNKLSSLPDNIRYLSSLKELYIDNNLLKTLPDAISELKCLRVLSCPFNKLKSLPPSIGRLKSLEKLYLQGNPAMVELPDALCRATALVHLVLDIGRYTHPPDNIVLEGTAAIMTYLAKHMGVDYNGPEVAIPESPPPDPQISYERELELLRRRDREIEDRVRRHEEKKDEKVLKIIEKEMSAQKDLELRFQMESRSDKGKLVEELLEQENKLSQRVQMYQAQRDEDRCRLIEQLQLVELSAEQLIDEMLAANNALKDPEVMIEQEERDRLALEAIFSKRNDELRRTEVMNAMESLLAEERAQREKLLEYAAAREEVVRNSLSREEEWRSEVEALLTCRSATQRAVAAEAAAAERDQVVAVATLLERSDLESVRLAAQLGLVQKHLAAITALELKHRNLRLDSLQCDLSEKRVALSELLEDMMEQQQKRRKHLLETLIRMEHNRWEVVAEEGMSSEDYWLVQYQRVLDSMPTAGFASGLDTRLVHQTVVHGVVHCLPMLAAVLAKADEKAGPINDPIVSEEDLEEGGITRPEDRAALLKALTAFAEERAGMWSAVASAPEEEETPSAPPPEDQECVVCMTYRSDRVFIPCGHLCCCSNCSNQLSHCPLCRGAIERFIKVIPAW